jgi:hypothetical protein
MASPSLTKQFAAFATAFQLAHVILKISPIAASAPGTANLEKTVPPLGKPRLAGWLTILSGYHGFGTPDQIRLTSFLQ